MTGSWACLFLSILCRQRCSIFFQCLFTLKCKCFHVSTNKCYKVSLHFKFVSIVTGERIRRNREGEKKYETKFGPRLSVDDVMCRTKLHEYHNSYAKAMKPFGLHSGIVGSTSKLQANSEYYRQLVSSMKRI